MNYEREEDCDRCDATIITDAFDNRQPIQLVVQKDEDEFQRELRTLCDECEMELLDWIDGDDSPDRADRVNLPREVRAAVHLERTANELLELSGMLQEGMEAEE